jgi:agmatinase
MPYDPRYQPANSLDSPRFTGVRTFGRLPHLDDLDAHVDCALLGAPFDTGATYRVGARFGPEAIRSASALLRRYNPAQRITVFDWLSVVDHGDIAIVPGYAEDSLARIEEHVRRVVDAGVCPLVLGGDHTITLAELRALAGRFGPLGLVQLDAHSDTTASYFGRAHTHGTPFWNAAEEGLLDVRRVVQVGLRGSLYSDRDLVVPTELGFDVIPAPEVHEFGMPRVAERIRATIGSGPAFLSFDIDFIDPAYAPATGTPEVGGFTTWQAVDLVRRLTSLRFVGFDIVEVIPQYDVGSVTSLAAANIAFEFLTLLALRRRDESSDGRSQGRALEASVPGDPRDGGRA